MTKAIKYIARWNGTIVGTRKSHRNYTHAVVDQRDEAGERAYAYQYKATDTDRKNFDYQTEVAACEGVILTETLIDGIAGQRLDTLKGLRPLIISYTASQIANAKANIEGGFDTYVERVRQDEIKRFEHRLAKGDFEPYVACWCGRRDLADKERRKYFRGVVVPAEVA